MTTVLLVDDHQIFRKGLSLLLADVAGLRVVGEAGNGRTAIELAEKLAPDVVVMDINMPDVDGIEATRQIIAEHDNTRVIALSMYGDERFVEDMLRAGALGYLLKESAPEELLDGIRSVAQGELFLSATIQDVVISQYMRRFSGASVSETERDADNPINSPILLTKLHRPQLHPRNVRRQRLLVQLEAGRNRPLTLVSAPAGYGKSTLISQWLESIDCPSVWLSLDESENDLRAFLTYVVAAIKTVFPSLIPNSSALLQTETLPPIRILAGTLINELEQAPERFILVLDDLHRITEPAVHELLGELLRYPSGTMHLVLTTRVDPVLDLLQLRAYQRVSELRARALSFTVDETATFLENVVGEPVDKATATLLTEKTEGWPTGLHLITLAIRDESDLRNLPTTLQGERQSLLQGERQSLDYLVAEALSGQPSEIQTWLLKTSTLDRFCAPLCSALFSEADGSEENRIGGKEFIRWLTQKNLFIVPLDHRGQWFRYHHLFQDLLQRALAQTSTPAEIDELRVRAAHWFADNTLLDEAIEYAVAAHDVAYAMDLVLQNRYALMDAEQWNRLERWISALPADAVAQNPLLLSTLAYLNEYRGQLDVALGFCEQATVLLAAVALDETDRKTVQAELAILQALLSFVRGESRHDFASVQSALALVPTRAFYIHRYGLVASAFALQSSGDMDQAVTLLTVNPQSRGRASDPNYRSTAWLLCLIQALDGDLSGVVQSANRCLFQAVEPKLNTPFSLGRYFLGTSHYLRNELALAEPHLTAIFEDIYSVRPTYAVHGSIMLALLRTAQGRDKEADQIMKRLLDYTVETQRAQSTAIARAFQVELALRQGKIAALERLDALADFERYALVWFVYIPQFTAVKLLLWQETQESLALAGAKLDVLEEFLRSNYRNALLIDLLALQALRHHAQGNDSDAATALIEALRLAVRSGAIRNFIDLGASMAGLLRQVRKEPIDPALSGFCEQILAAVEPAASSLPAPPQNGMLDPLTERESQTLRLLATELSTDEIAEQLVVGVGTVRTHTRSIYSKLYVHSRFEAVTRAKELSIL